MTLNRDNSDANSNFAKLINPFESDSLNNQNRNFQNLFEHDLEAFDQPDRHFYWKIEGH